MKKLYFLIIILVLAAAAFILLKKGETLPAYDFILHFDDAEKKNFENGAELDSFLPSKTLSFPPEVIQAQVFLLFSNQLHVILKDGVAGEKFNEETGRGGFRFIFPPKRTAGDYEFILKKKDESNYWAVQFSLNAGSSGIKIIRCKNGVSQNIDAFNYNIKNAEKQVFMVVFFSDFLLVMDENDILFQMRDQDLMSGGKIAMDRKTGSSKNPGEQVKFAVMTEGIEKYLVNWHNANFPSKQYHSFDYREREWNRITYRPNLIVHGETNDFLRRLKIGTQVRPSILFRMNSSLSYVLKVHENSVLEFCLSAVPIHVYQTGRLNFKVNVERIHGSGSKDFSYNFGASKKKPGPFVPLSMDLKEFGGSKCRVTFSFSTTDGKLIADEKKVVLALASPAVYSRSGKDDYNVILISLDTLRASSLGCYGYERETSKYIDEFAREGTVFRNATACSDWTLPSHMSMMTSMYPFESGLYKNEKSTLKKIGLAFGGTFIEDKVQTIAGYLQESGYKTIAVHGGGYVSDFYGFDKGFNVYDRMSAGVDQAVELAEKYIERNKQHKFFLFFHTYEIHDPYKHDYFVSQLPPSERNYKNNTVARYDSGIRFTDVQIGKLISWLKQNGLFEKTLIIITSDHGENFDRLRTKEGAGSHGNTLYDSEIHVPLILGGPAAFNQKISINDQVSSADILPTIMDFLNIPVEGEIRGVSLIPLINGERLPSRAAYSEGIHLKEEKKSLRTLENKVIADMKSNNIKNVNEVNYEFYDLVKDKPETENLYISKPASAKSFIQRLWQIVESIDANRKKLSGAKYKVPQHDQELMKELKGLGYIGN